MVAFGERDVWEGLGRWWQLPASGTLGFPGDVVSRFSSTDPLYSTPADPYTCGLMLKYHNTVNSTVQQRYWHNDIN